MTSRKKAIVTIAAVALIAIIATVLFEGRESTQETSSTSAGAQRTSANELPSMDASTSPPSPPAQGNVGAKSSDFSAALHGKDVNANGVRDDVEGNIQKTYRYLPERNAAMQFARSFEKYAFDSSTDRLITENWITFDRSMACMSKTFGKDSWTKTANDIQSQILNTEERFHSYIELQRAAGGKVYPFTMEKNPCD